MERAEALATALAVRGGPRLPVVEWPESIASTSERLKAMARGGAPEWTVVLAGQQTGGRGREGRTWASPPGGLYLSVLLRPRFEKTGLLPLAAGVAVAEAAGDVGVRTELKWPNDVLASGRKLAGILSEAASGPDGVEWVVLGIGVNVSAESLPPGIREGATSLAAQGAADLSLPAVGASVLAHLAVCYDGLRSSPAAALAAWRSRAAPWWGGLVDVRTAEGSLQGLLREVDEDGALVVELAGGRRQRLLSGEVTRVRPAGGR
ncbi:MAG TPA: biotin--[acetyl-CoA-carboxylase] ligase [Vicinamibacteria bacterium]|nr:biotin--[acetyl-CoA-carboxylase] ligase [Vicinamibacteria bacterium]